MSISLYRVLCIVGAFGLAACATSPEPVLEEAPQALETPSVIEAPAEATPVPTAPAFAESDFLDKAPGELDALLGDPALIRTEGSGQFRRYDTSTCRIYAVVTQGKGGRARVASISAGPLVAGDPAPSFGSCFVTGS